MCSHKSRLDPRTWRLFGKWTSPDCRIDGLSSPGSVDDDYHFPGLAHTAFPLAPDIRKHLKLDRFGYAPGAAVDTISLQKEDRKSVV